MQKIISTTKGIVFIFFLLLIAGTIVFASVVSLFTAFGMKGGPVADAQSSKMPEFKSMKVICVITENNDATKARWMALVTVDGTQGVTGISAMAAHTLVENNQQKIRIGDLYVKDDKSKLIAQLKKTNGGDISYFAVCSQQSFDEISALAKQGDKTQFLRALRKKTDTNLPSNLLESIGQLLIQKGIPVTQQNEVSKVNTSLPGSTTQTVQAGTGNSAGNTTQQPNQVQGQTANNATQGNKEPVTVEVLNATGKNGLAARVAEILNGKGYVVKKTGNLQTGKRTNTSVIVHTSASDGKDIIDILQVGKVKSEIDPVNAVDITVIVGDDYK